MKAKNIGLLATLALVTTVGGVYATFNYGITGKIESVNVDTQANIVATAENSTKGTLSVKIELDEGKAVPFEFINGGENKAVLAYYSDLVVTFTPSTFTSEEIKTGIPGINVKAEVTAGGTYGSPVKQIFTIWGDVVTSASETIDAGTRKLTWSIPLENIIGANNDPTDGIDLNLETLDEYEAFYNAVVATKFKFTISEA